MATAPHDEVGEMLNCSDGMRLAYQQWSVKSNPPVDQQVETKTRNILCLHGWLDNAASFYKLGPELAERLSGTHIDGVTVTNSDVNVVALDFLGHGRSTHKSMDGPSILLSESAFYVAEAIEQLGWWKEHKSNGNKRKKGEDGEPVPQLKDDNTPFVIVGHSMGAAIACVLAAAFPERVDRLVLLEGAGPLDRPASSIAKHIRNHIERRHYGNMKVMMAPRAQYANLEAAVNLRMKTASNFPGNQSISREAATELVLRGSKVSPDGRVEFCHDPRLRWPSAHYFTLEQVEALYAEIKCPTCILTAKDGFPMEEEKRNRLIQLLKPEVMKPNLPGSHHFHADPITAPRVAEEVVNFLRY